MCYIEVTWCFMFLVPFVYIINHVFCHKKNIKNNVFFFFQRKRVPLGYDFYSLGKVLKTTNKGASILFFGAILQYEMKLHIES